MIDDIVRRKGLLALGSRLKRISERLQSEVQDLLDLHDVPIQAFQYPLLTTLAENGALEIGQIAKTLGVAQPGVTRNVSQLSKQGLVSVSRDDRDKRVRRVDLTDAGRDVIQQGRDVIWPAIELYLGEILSETDGSLLDHLGRLEDGLAAETMVARAARSEGAKAND